MKKYTFRITGASPYDGEIIIIAKTWKVAKRMAANTVEQYNKISDWSTVRFTGQDHCEPFEPPCVVHFESGEA